MRMSADLPQTGRIGAWPVMLAALLLGLSLQFNPLSSTWGLPFMRLSDAFSIAAGAVFFLYLPADQRIGLALTAAPFLFTASLSLMLKSFRGQGDAYMTLMLMAHFVSTLMMLTLGYRDKRIAVYLSIGVLIGFGLALTVLALRVGGVDLTSMGLGVPSVGWAVGDLMAKVKPGGLWSQGNEAGHVFALAGAPALYLSLVYRRPLIYTIYFFAFLASFSMTLNRGGVIAPTAGLVIAYLAAGKGEALTKALLAIIGGVALLGALSFLPIFAGVREVFERRFLHDYDLGNNVFGRSETFWAGVHLALAHPFGLGLVERVNQMQFAARIGSPHNGLIALAFQAGLGVVVFYVAALFKLLSNPATYRSLPVLMALFSLPSMFFEELSVNPVFLFTIGLTLAEAMRIVVVANRHRAPMAQLDARSSAHRPAMN